MTARRWATPWFRRAAAITTLLAIASLVFVGGVASNVLSDAIPSDWLKNKMTIAIALCIGLAAATCTVLLSRPQKAPAGVAELAERAGSLAKDSESTSAQRVTISQLCSIIPGEWSMDRNNDPAPPVRAIFAFDDNGRYRLTRVANRGHWRVAVAFGGRETKGIWRVADDVGGNFKLSLYAVQTKWPFPLSWIGLDQVHSLDTASGETHFSFIITKVGQDRLDMDKGAHLRRLRFPHF